MNPSLNFVTRGFTLLEVLVALAIVAVALTAVVRATGQSIDLGAGLRDRTLALWVAEDRLAEHQLRRYWPSTNTTEGTVEVGNRTWRWREKVSATEVAEMRRIDIEIRLREGDVALARLSGFLLEPQGAQPSP